MSLSFVLHHAVKSDAEKVKPFFENMERFAEVHPLIQSATLTGPHQYLIRERMAFSFFKFTYKAEVSTHHGNEIHYIAYPFFLVLTIKFKFAFLKEENATIITESIHIKGPTLVAHILKRAVIYAHKKVVKHIKKTVEF
jgi:carbon monoxide dehydrogenase subunit G